MKMTINYQMHYWPDGTVYRQFVKIDEELQKKYNEALDAEYKRNSPVMIQHILPSCFTISSEKCANMHASILTDELTANYESIYIST